MCSERRVVAQDVYGNRVNVRGPGVYEMWQHRAGLFCRQCRGPVHLKKLTGGVWVWHNGGSGAFSHGTSGGGREGPAHIAVKNWVKDWSVRQGFRAWTEREEDDSRPDVRVEGRGRKIAIEVQLQHLPRGKMQVRTDRLQHQGFEVLWLAHDSDLVHRLPAVRLQIESVRSKFNTTEIHGAFHSVGLGRLSLIGERLRPVPRKPALETFVRDFVVGGLSWAEFESGKKGWAMPDEWRSHVKWQADEIDQLKRRLTRVEDARQRAEKDSTRSASRASEAVRLAAKETLRADVAESRAKSLAYECTSAKQRADRERSLRMRLSTAVRRRLLGRLMFKGLLAEVESKAQV